MMGRMDVLQSMRGSAPFFLLLGTTGLLLNELFFEWGRLATISFAALNVLGLAQFVFIYVWMKKSERHDEP